MRARVGRLHSPLPAGDRPRRPGRQWRIVEPGAEDKADRDLPALKQFMGAILQIAPHVNNIVIVLQYKTQENYTTKNMPNTFHLACGLALVLAGAGFKAQAQGVLASGQITGIPFGLNYDYSMTVSNSGTATSAIGSFWYAWTPGQFYLPSIPSNPFAPSGWTATTSGHSIQFTALSSGLYILPGSSLSGFGFTSADTPAQLAGNATAQGFPSTPVGTTVAYPQSYFISPSQTFVFTTTVPEPSALALLGLGLVCSLAKRRGHPCA